HFDLRERWTLFVVALPMGAWVAGTLMAEIGQRIFSRPGFRGTVVTPGQNEDEVLRFVEQLSRHYDQTIFVTAASSMVEWIAAGAGRNILWADLECGLLTGGQPTTEPQRERILEGFGKDPERLRGCVGMFASAEAGGMLGYETHVCLLIRRLCVRTPVLAGTLFGSPLVPSLNQYDPLNAFLEVVDGEILLTLRGAVPLVRFNTHDRGGLLSFERVVDGCRAHGYDLLHELEQRGFGPDALRPLPFLYVYGRSDAVIARNANVYRDHVAHVLQDPALHAA